MHKLLLLATTTVAIAQSPLVTTFANDNGGAVGGAIYFDLTANTTVTITGLDVNLYTAASTAGSVDVLTCPVTRVGNQTAAGAWTLVSTGAVTSAGPGVGSTVAIAPFALAPGPHGMAFRGVGQAFAYTLGTGSNQNYATGALALAAGEASNLAFAAPLFTPRVVNCRIAYTLPPGVVEAAATSYGPGCYQRARSFYENFATAAAFDLGNHSLSMLRSGANYTVQPGVVSYVAPTGAATVLPLGDDDEIAVTLAAPFPYGAGATTTLTVCSNGFVSVASGNGTAFLPSVAALLNGPQTGWYCWHDYDVTIPSSGQVKFQTVGTKAIITWDGAWDYGGTSSADASTFQMQFDTANGNVHFVWRTMSTNGASGVGHLVGYSAGGPSLDPGNRDITATLPATFPAGDDQLPLTLAATRPTLNTTVALTTTNIPAGATIAATVLSVVINNPGPDLGALGAPGCRSHVGAGSSQLFVPPGASTTQNLPVPNNPGFIGIVLGAQSAVFTPGVNAIGLLTSNGVRLSVGNL